MDTSEKVRDGPGRRCGTGGRPPGHVNAATRRLSEASSASCGSTGSSAVDRGGRQRGVHPEPPSPSNAPVYRLELMDASGKQRAAAELGRWTFNHAVSTSGHVLALAADSARWYDADAKPLTDWFAADAGGLEAIGLERCRRPHLEPSVRKQLLPLVLGCAGLEASSRIRGGPCRMTRPGESQTEPPPCCSPTEAHTERAD